MLRSIAKVLAPSRSPRFMASVVVAIVVLALSLESVVWQVSAAGFTAVRLSPSTRLLRRVALALQQYGNQDELPIYIPPTTCPFPGGLPGVTSGPDSLTVRRQH